MRAFSFWVEESEHVALLKLKQELAAKRGVPITMVSWKELFTSLAQEHIEKQQNKLK